MINNDIIILKYFINPPEVKPMGLLLNIIAIAGVIAVVILGIKLIGKIIAEIIVYIQKKKEQRRD